MVDDPSRWTPVREALPIVLGRLRDAGVRPSDVSISVGVGRHHAVDADEMRSRVGDAVVDAYRCFSPPVDDRSAYVHLGETPGGVPVRVFRPVAEADLRILIGSVLPHLQAGFGGGYKLIFPGTSHRSTLGALHRSGLAGDAGLLLGNDPGSNPMRRAVREAARLLRGPCVSISHILGAPGQVVRVEAGHPDPVQERLAAEAQTAVPGPFLAAGRPGRRGQPSLAGRPDAELQGAVAAPRREPAGGRPGRLLLDRSRPDRPLVPDALAPRDRGLGRPGGWAIRRGLAAADRLAGAVGSPAAFMIRWARELVVDRTVLVYAPPLRDRIGPRLGPIRLFADQGLLWRAASSALGDSTAPRIRVFPQGGLTYAPQPVV